MLRRSTRPARPLVLAALTALAGTLFACDDDCTEDLRPGGGRVTLPTDGGPVALPPGTTWQWQIDGSVEQGLDVTVYDIDLFDVSEATITQLRDAGHIVICYFSAGSVEEWREDADRFPVTAVGEPLDGWPGERWLDVRAPAVRTAMAARLDLARDKGCHGVEPDNVDAMSNGSGFPLTEADQVDYNRWLADESHARGLSVGLKNVPHLAEALEPYFDWALTEECLDYDECAPFGVFLDAGKAVFHVEYVDEACDEDVHLAPVCDAPEREGFSTLIKQWDLHAWGVNCP